MNELAEKFFKWADGNGWRVEFVGEKRELPKNITERYKYIPEGWLDFVRCFGSCSNGADNVWFILSADFEDNDGGFRYNEFEMISLAAAENDERRKNIREFWDNYLPIVMSVAGDYHYYAIGIKTGEVFEGWEPDFEEPEICAISFTDFVQKIISGKIVLM